MRSARTSSLAGLALVLVLAVGVVGCGSPTATPDAAASAAGVASASTTTPATASATPTATPTASATASVTFASVVDGDTIQTSAGTVRIIGIDTPERGQCGHDEASMAIGRLLASGDPVTLELPAGQNDRDQHGRLIRYVLTSKGVDLGLMQLEAGHAIARFDSTDGYPAHPRQAAYHAAQVASAGPDGAVVPVVCQGKSTASVAPAPQSVAPSTEASEPEEPWWRQYSSCTKLKKNTAGHPKGPFRKNVPAEADIYDWFANGTGNRGDGDNDGLACE